MQAGLALGIKYLNNKSFYIDRCLKLQKPIVNQALAYVLKYLPHEEAVKYFETLFQTEDKTTQIILFNEIPLLAKRKAGSEEMQDDINAQLKEIIPDRIYTFYMIAEKYAMPSTVEHLASFVHLLPANKLKQQYRKITNIKIPELQERLLWKFSYLPQDMQPYAVKRLAEVVEEPGIKEKVLEIANRVHKENFKSIEEFLAQNEVQKD